MTPTPSPLLPNLNTLAKLKAPLVPNGAPVVNALFTQRCAIVNLMRACLGLSPDNHMTLEHRFESTLAALSSDSEPANKKMRHS